MSVIIRLQNLPWSANALDIRQYFHGLSIPEGGVHIVGGEQGDAFIAFSTDEDARQAFLRSSGRIKEVQITLMLSSRTEMQKVIEQARNQSYAAFMAPQPTPAQVPPLPAAVPQIAPAPVPEIKKERDESRGTSRDRIDSDRKKDKKRSRSRSRDRDRDSKNKDRSKSSARRHRDRSRSRSRDRRDRRRRDRSRSRNRSRSRDKDSSRKSRNSSSSKRSEDRTIIGNTLSFEGPVVKKPMPEVWVNRPQPEIIPPVVAPPQSLLGSFPISLDQAKRTLDTLSVGLQAVNGFPIAAAAAANLTTFGNANRNPQRDSWPPQQQPQSLLQNQNSAFNNNRDSDAFQENNRNRDRPSRDDRDNRQMRGGNRDNYINRDRDNRDGNNQYDGGKGGRFQKRDYNQRDNIKEERGDFRDRGSRDRSIEENPFNACVSVEPFYGSYGDLRRFFSGLFISFKGIKILNDEEGHRTGVCYIQFANRSQKEGALKKDRDELNGIGVKIRHIDDEEFLEAIDRYTPVMDDYGSQDSSDNKSNANSQQSKFAVSRNITKYFNQTAAAPPQPEIKEFSCLKLEDLPSYAKQQDILHIFALHPLISVHFLNKPRGAHVAYAKFSSKEVARQALEDKTNHVIGGKTITVMPCKDEEFDEINKEHDEAMQEVKKEPEPVTIQTDCLSITNLPQSKINDRDISDFFSDVGVIPTKIHLMSNNLGFTGQAYCEFQTNDEATKAASKDQGTMGNIKITITPISREDMTNVLSNSLPGPPAPLQPAAAISPIRPQVPPQLPQLQPPKVELPPRPLFRPRGPGGDQPNGGPPRMFGFRGGPGPRGGPRFGPRGGPGGPRHRFPPQHQQNDEEAPPGCTVYMHNVPYKAGTNEILDFFEGYNSTNIVSRRYNPNNTPSAEAKVTFHNADDAFRAVQELNGQTIWKRPIHLEQA